MKNFGVTRKSTLKLTKAFQEEKAGLKKEVEAFKIHHPAANSNISTTAEDRVRALEERLRRTERERDEAKRSMERSNIVLNNRIRRLEEQLNNITGAINEVS